MTNRLSIYFKIGHAVLRFFTTCYIAGRMVRSLRGRQQCESICKRGFGQCIPAFTAEP